MGDNRVKGDKDMTTDAISTCPPGKEQYEKYYSYTLKKWLFQYEYRTKGGNLFTCTTDTLEGARQKRDEWIIQEEMK
jgi:hypothetical protein